MSIEIDWTKEFGTGRKNFYIKSTEVANLPTDVLAGSTAFCADTGEAYVFTAEDKKWNKQ